MWCQEPLQTGVNLDAAAADAAKAVEAGRAASRRIALDMPVHREKMDYREAWEPHAPPPKSFWLPHQKGKPYKLQSTSLVQGAYQVLSRWADGSPRTVHEIGYAPYEGAASGKFWPIYEYLPGCIPSVLDANYAAVVTIDPAAQNIRGAISQWINDVDTWSYTVNRYYQDGSTGWGSRVRVGVDAGLVMTPGENTFTLMGHIDPYECFSLGCGRCA